MSFSLSVGVSVYHLSCFYLSVSSGQHAGVCISAEISSLVRVDLQNSYPIIHSTDRELLQKGVREGELKVAQLEERHRLFCQERNSEQERHRDELQNLSVEKIRLEAVRNSLESKLQDAEEQLRCHTPFLGLRSSMCGLAFCRVVMFLSLFVLNWCCSSLTKEREAARSEDAAEMTRQMVDACGSRYCSTIASGMLLPESVFPASLLCACAWQELERTHWREQKETLTLEVNSLRERLVVVNVFLERTQEEVQDLKHQVVLPFVPRVPSPARVLVTVESEP